MSLEERSTWGLGELPARFLFLLYVDTPYPARGMWLLAKARKMSYIQTVHIKTLYIYGYASC